MNETEVKNKADANRSLWKTIMADDDKSVVASYAGRMMIWEENGCAVQGDKEKLVKKPCFFSITSDKEYSVLFVAVDGLSMFSVPCSYRYEHGFHVLKSIEGNNRYILEEDDSLWEEAKMAYIDYKAFSKKIEERRKRMMRHMSMRGHRCPLSFPSTDEVQNEEADKEDSSNETPVNETPVQEPEVIEMEVPNDMPIEVLLRMLGLI